MNTITITGNLVQDARDIKKGDNEFVAIRLANTYKDSTVYVDALICGGAAKFAKDAKKGAAVLVSGQLRQREYSDKDGNKRVSYSVVGYDFEKLDHAQSAGAGRSGDELPF